MTIAEMFKTFLANLAMDNTAQISQRYGELTGALNKKYRNTDSKTANTLQVGSYGRRTAIRGTSDLDMLYIMPASRWADYKDGKQLKLLQDTKKAIDERYPSTDTKVDRYVVVVSFQNFKIEIEPAFEQTDGSYLFPDTYGDGRWLTTKPRLELDAVSTLDGEKNNNLRQFCKMARAWKNQHGVVMGGLLIDTLAYSFLKANNDYDSTGFSSHHFLARDFFAYLKDETNKDYYLAPGSNQHVKVAKRFQRKAKKAYKLSEKAIEAGDKDVAHDKWKKIFGRPFPGRPKAVTETVLQKSGYTYDNTEQHIEDCFPVDIKYNLRIDCEVSQNGFREFLLRDVLRRKIPLRPKKQLMFRVTQNDVPQPYSIRWKVLNRGGDTYKRNSVRGQLLHDQGREQRKERTDFRGEHIVDCYVVKDGVVVAKDRINVPIA